MIVSALLLWLVGCGAILAFVFWRDLARAWREPVLTVPVLIIESDDWGYGPAGQAGALARIADTLAAHCDRTGRTAVMTLGVVLGGPDTERIEAQACREYHRLTLADATLGDVRSAMIEGTKRGVFALQLHGMEHYWPPILLAAAATDPRVRAWLTTPGLPRTETLPAHLQSRWIDASTLPSRPLPREDIERGVHEEVREFRSLLATQPDVVVPPTFVWSPAVEAAWARAGVIWLVAPGRRHDRRDAAGRPVAVHGAIANGERGPSGLMYLVRDEYFEPALGHTAERVISSMRAKTRCGRPTLLETHRANFIGDDADATRAIVELDRMLDAARSSFHDLRFMPSAELGRGYRDASALIEPRIAPRIHCFLSRLAEHARLRKLAWASGLIVPAALLWSVTRASRRPHRVAPAQASASRS